MIVHNQPLQVHNQPWWVTWLSPGSPDFHSAPLREPSTPPRAPRSCGSNDLPFVYFDATIQSGAASVLFSPCALFFFFCDAPCESRGCEREKQCPSRANIARAKARPIGAAQATPPPSRAAWLLLGLLRVAPLACYFRCALFFFFCDLPPESRGREGETQRPSRANSLAPTFGRSVWLKSSSHPAAQPRGLAATAGAAARGAASVLFPPRSLLLFCDAPRVSRGCECEKQRPSHAHRKK